MKKPSHIHRNWKTLPYGIKDSKRATEWCSFDDHKIPVVVDKGAVKNKVRKDIRKQIDDLEGQ